MPELWDEPGVWNHPWDSMSWDQRNQLLMTKTLDWQIHLFSETEAFWRQCSPFKVETTSFRGKHSAQLELWSSCACFCSAPRMARKAKPSKVRGQQG